MSRSFSTSRRQFFKTSVFGSLAVAASARWPGLLLADDDKPVVPTTRAALTTGDDRADLAFRGLKEFSKQIAQAIGDRTVVIKPNNVAIDIPLCATHAGTIEGILEFLKSIGKASQAVIAESAANGPTMDGFANYGYLPLAQKYGAKLVDLDKQPFERIHVFDEKDFRPHAVRMSKLLLDRNNFIISAARMKTHDRVVATLSLKNIVFGAPIKDEGFRWGKASKPGAKNDKPIAHGSGFRGINFNLYQLAQKLHPHLSVIDGFEGMEGNGPCGGTPVDHRVCVVSPDWFAADRLGVELMGIDFAKVGYLNFCADAGLGDPDLRKIEVLGEPVARHIKPYKLHAKVEQQLIWQKPVDG